MKLTKEEAKILATHYLNTTSKISFGGFPFSENSYALAVGRVQQFLQAGLISELEISEIEEEIEIVLAELKGEE